MKEIQIPYWHFEYFNWIHYEIDKLWFHFIQNHPVSSGPSTFHVQISKDANTSMSNSMFCNPHWNRKWYTLHTSIGHFRTANSNSKTCERHENICLKGSYTLHVLPNLQNKVEVLTSDKSIRIPKIHIALEFG